MRKNAGRRQSRLFRPVDRAGIDSDFRSQPLEEGWPILRDPERFRGHRVNRLCPVQPRDARKSAEHEQGGLDSVIRNPPRGGDALSQPHDLGHSSNWND